MELSQTICVGTVPIFADKIVQMVGTNSELQSIDIIQVESKKTRHFLIKLFKLDSLFQTPCNFLIKRSDILDF